LLISLRHFAAITPFSPLADFIYADISPIDYYASSMPPLIFASFFAAHFASAAAAMLMPLP